MLTTTTATCSSACRNEGAGRYLLSTYRGNKLQHLLSSSSHWQCQSIPRVPLPSLRRDRSRTSSTLKKASAKTRRSVAPAGPMLLLLLLQVLLVASMRVERMQSTTRRDASSRMPKRRRVAHPSRPPKPVASVAQPCRSASGNALIRVAAGGRVRGPEPRRRLAQDKGHWRPRPHHRPGRIFLYVVWSILRWRRTSTIALLVEPLCGNQPVCRVPIILH